jgi:6-phosphogluconolactonase
LAFNEDGNRLYLIHEITAEIGVYAYENETISHLETKSLLEEGYKGEVGAAEVRLSPDGKFLYASNRGEANDIIAFGIDQETGKLSLVQHQASQGETPRNFAITPDGDYLISGNQQSNNLVSFKRDQQTGQLTPMGATLSLKKPVYIHFLK